MKLQRVGAILLAGLLTTVSSVSFGQLNMSSNIQTNHLWRGGEVADGVVLTSDVSTSLLSSGLHVGFWGATNVVGTYKEFNYYASYSCGGFSASLWDIYNFSDFATYNNTDFFDYGPTSTGRFLDATVGYNFGDSLPLQLSWSTILFGRDRNDSNSENRYSTYLYAQYPIFKCDVWRVDAGMGGAFALNPMGQQAHFYGEHAGIVQLSMVISRQVEIAEYTLPLSITTMWNPQSGQAYMQLAARLFSF